MTSRDEPPIAFDAPLRDDAVALHEALVDAGFTVNVPWEGHPEDARRHSCFFPSEAQAGLPLESAVEFVKGIGAERCVWDVELRQIIRMVTGLHEFGSAEARTVQTPGIELSVRMRSDDGRKFRTTLLPDGKLEHDLIKEARRLPLLFQASGDVHQ